MKDQVPTEPDEVERLAEEFLARYRAGDRPNIDQFVGNDGEIADELRSLLKAIVILEQNAPWADPTERAGPEGAATAAEVPHQIGDYLIQREIGRGGMGIVYQAAQQSLDRQVALKVLSSPGILDSAHLERFRREARAAARLQHSHIVPVFDFGTQSGTYYYAMQLIVGQSLDIVIRSLQNSRSKTKSELMEREGDAPAEPKTAATSHDGNANSLAASDTECSSTAENRQFYRNIARIGSQAAEALAYAHAEGVLHRDVKPSNLLLDSKGNLWMTDFGLAKADGDDELTHTGDFLGTLRYTAPERLEGWSDRRSDIYGLGVTLYELLTLQPFFPDRSRTELLRRIAGSSPVAPRRIEPSIPVDLETIVLKAVAKEPAARYHRAEQMAEDLRRFLADRPILARRSTVLERFGRWCRRNPAVASLAAMVVGLLVTAVIILAIGNAKIRRESAARIAALKERQDALTAKDEAWGKVWLYRGLYEIDGDEAQTLANFDKALELAPNKADILWLRGFMLGSWGRYDEAAADMTSARTMLGDSKLISPAARDWFVASVFAAKGDRAAYQTACREALQKIRSEHDPDELGILLWMCTVTPYSVDKSARLADLADLVLLPNREAPTRDQLLAVGAALYRAGMLDEARRRLQEALQQCAAKKPTVDPMSEVFAHLFLAMTDERLGLADQAQANLADASRLAKTIKPPCWVSKMQFRMLTEEARTIVGAASESLVEQTPGGD